MVMLFDVLANMPSPYTQTGKREYWSRSRDDCYPVAEAIAEYVSGLDAKKQKAVASGIAPVYFLLAFGKLIGPGLAVERYLYNESRKHSKPTEQPQQPQPIKQPAAQSPAIDNGNEWSGTTVTGERATFDSDAFNLDNH